MPTVRDLLIWIICPDCGRRVAELPWTLIVLPHYVRAGAPIYGQCPASGQCVIVGLKLPPQMLAAPYGQ